MNSSRRQFLETGAKFCAAAIVWTSTTPRQRTCTSPSKARKPLGTKGSTAMTS